MLSICIPHYNFVNPTLFQNLFRQAKLAEIKFEIIIADDASLPDKKQYLEAFALPEFKKYFLKENIGRSAIRNFLASKAQYPHLLFLDADSEIISETFIADYLKNRSDKIICGGRLYSNQQPTPEYFLHYKYGSQVEQFAASHFQSNNFMLPITVFSSLVFDEGIKTYGYEDVVFGLGARRLGLEIVKTNNPVVHSQLKTNEEFVNDMEEALKNLKKLIDTNRDWRLEKEVNVSAFYRKLRRFRLTFLLSIRLDEVLRKAKELLFLNIPIGSTLLITVYKLYYYHLLHKR